MILLVLVSSATILAQEKTSDQQIYIQTDQPYYVSGESIHYSTFLFNSEKKKLENLNEIINVQLVGQNMSLSDRILSRKGLANGVFEIPDSVQSGDFMLFAYTNSMLTYQIYL